MVVFFTRFVVARENFGEAAWRAQPSLSWQTTVVGDPLYRPFAKLPQEQHAELTARRSPLVAWSHLKVVNLNLGMGTPIAKAIEYLNGLSETRQSSVLMEKLGDLYAATGKQSEAADAYLRATRLDTTPHQRMRLYPQAAARLAAASRESEAIYAWADFLKDFPTHPDRPSIYRLMSTLAEKLGRTEEAEKYKRLATP
jgi:tetratricopeptide (TPR) repeat protein